RRNESAYLLGNVVHCTRNRFLRLRRRLPRPREVEDRLRGALGDQRGEQPDVVVITLRILERQRALLLEDDVIPWLRLQGLLSATGIPVPLEARAPGNDHLEIDALRTLRCGREIRHTTRQIV